VRKAPYPRLIQRALSDFYVEYQFVMNLNKPGERILVLSDLHAQIQDAFNESGVQIMSPHLHSQPSGKMFVPKSQWFVESADVSANSGQRKTVT
jgi:small-conductance mechanosensitive channel